MGLFNKLFLKKESTIFAHDTIVQEATEQAPDQGLLKNFCSSTSYSTEQESEHAPLWLSVPSNENREKDKANTSDYSNVHIIFKYGEIQNVIPDVNNYYLATHYNINGIVYDITDISSINKIPIPTSKPPAEFRLLGTPVYRLEYLLRIHAGFAREKGDNELAYALMHKGTEMLKFSSLDWQRHDYLREYYWLLDDDKIEEAEAFFKEIEVDLPAPYSTKEYTKEIQHYNYAILKRNFPKDMPKSFSAYMRNYNKQDLKFQKYEELAKSLGITI